MSDSPCPSDFAIERHLASELGPDDPVAAHVTTCERCVSRILDMQRQGDSYLASPEAERARTLIRDREPAARKRTPQGRILPSWTPLLLAALSLGAVALFLQGPRPEEREGSGVDLTAKGPAELLLWVDEPAGPVPLAGDSIPFDTKIQCGIRSTVPGFVAGFVRDGDGLVRLFPDGKEPLAYAPGTPAPLGPSFRSDPGLVTVSLYFASERFDVAALEAALRRGDATFDGMVLERRVSVASQ